MLFYIILLLLLAFGTLLFKDEKNKLKFFCITLGLVSVLRYNVGSDYPNYLAMASGYLIYRVEQLEPLSRLVFIIANYLEWPYLVFFIFGGLTCLFLYLGIRGGSSDYMASAMMYLAIYYVSSLSEIRQGLSLAILFWGLQFLKQKRWKLFCLICLFAFLFHFSALLGLLFIPLIVFPNKYKLLLACSVFLVLLEQDLLFQLLGTIPRLSYYLAHSDNFNSGGRYLKLGILLWFILLLLLDRDIQKHSGYYLLIIIGICMPFLENFHLGMRIYYIFTLSQILLVGEIMKCQQAPIRLGFAAACACYFLLFIYVSQGRYDYQSILFL